MWIGIYEQRRDRAKERPGKEDSKLYDIVTPTMVTKRRKQ
jgi:hypothetical protein